MRRWLGLAAALVAAALVVWVVAGDFGSQNSEKKASPPTDTEGSFEPTPGSGIIGGPDGITQNAEVGFNAAANNVIDRSTTPGGTLRLLSGSDCDSWDPGRTGYGWCWNLQRLISRTLVGYTSVNATEFKIGPDLATSLGRHNADYSKWTYTLRPGLRFSTGEPITPLDVKYGIERLFAVDVINGGPSAYFIDSIAHPKNYAGPYKSGDLSSIRTTAYSITFYLSTPDADFDYLMALPAAAPVPYRVEGGPRFTGATYGRHPVASGPFEFKSYHQRKSLTLARNPYWHQETDRIRHPLVDAVDLTVDSKPGDIDEKLKAGTADARADGGVEPVFASQLLTHDRFKAHADDPIQAATQYLAVSPAVIPDVHCRRAIFYAVDKYAAVRAFGGPTTGVPAKSMTPPGIEGYDPRYDPYPSGPSGTGDVAQAERELRLCGRPKGFRTKFIYPTPSEFGPYLFLAERKALGRVGIKISEEPGGSEPYGCTEASLALLGRVGVGLVSRSLSAEYPTGSGFYAQVPAGFPCLEGHGTNLRRLHDPTVNHVLDAAPRGQATDDDWRALDHAVMASATYLPLTWEKALYYRNPRLTNITCDNALASGSYDFVNVGVR